MRKMPRTIEDKKPVERGYSFHALTMLAKRVHSFHALTMLAKRVHSFHALTMLAKRVHSFHALTLLAASLFISGFASSTLDGGDIHEEVIKEGLAGTICPANIEVIVNGSKFQDAEATENETDQQRHFEAKTINRSYDYAKREQKKVLNYANNADSSSEARTRTLYHFGMMLHTLHDFYCNTNYLKLKVDEANRTESGDFDPYDLELYDWQKLTAGKTPAVGGKELKPEPVQAENFNKPLRDTTYGKVARGLAIRETARQWTYLEQLLKNRYGERAETIILALKKASCVKKIPTDAEEAIDAGGD
jgi:hypothetical protein